MSVTDTRLKRAITRLSTLSLAVLTASAASAGTSVFNSIGVGDDGQTQVIVRNADEGQDVVVVGAGNGESHSMRLRVEDGRVRIETEPDEDRPWLGVLLTGDADGRKVAAVMDGSPADKAGLKAGDVILRVDGEEVDGDQHLLEGHSPGDRVRMTVLRDGEEIRRTVRLGSHPGAVEFEADEGLQAFGIAGDVLGRMKGLPGLEGLSQLGGLLDLRGDADDGHHWLMRLGSKPRLGVVLESLSGQLAEYFGVEEGEGLLIKEVLEGSAADAAGLRAGDVILRIGDRDVKRVGDVRSALADVPSGESVAVEVLRRGVRETFDAVMDTPPAGSEHSALVPWIERAQEATEEREAAIRRAREAIERYQVESLRKQEAALEAQENRLLDAERALREAAERRQHAAGSARTF